MNEPRPPQQQQPPPQQRQPQHQRHQHQRRHQPGQQQPPQQPQQPPQRKENFLSRGVSHIKRIASNLVERLVGRRVISNKEIIINAEPLETRVAVMENNQLEELSVERTTEERLVGSIFKARIKNLENGLKAAFVDIGGEKNGFLHYWDILPAALDSSIEAVDRGGKRHEPQKRITQRDIPNLYPPGSEIVVQVTKGPIGTKGPRLTTSISLPGRYLVLMPFSDQSGISRKIDDDRERQRLRKIVRSLSIPDGMGVIIRTVGEGLKQRYFVRDLHLLLTAWRQVEENIKSKPAPSCVYQEPDLVERTVRDFLTEDISKIVVDNEKQAERMRDMIGQISRRSRNKVKLYADPEPIFEKTGVEKQIEQAFRRQVWLKCGGYIVIDETEALISIDVNTGRHKPGRDQEQTILQTNMEAAAESCRQLRLRNIGGLVVVDFIDMKNRKHQHQVYQNMREGVRRDRAKTHILPISTLGLLEMTRQRQTESVISATFEDCPYCKGRGMVKSALSMSVEIQRKISEVLRRHRPEHFDPENPPDIQLCVYVHTDVLQRLRSQDEHLLIELEKKFYGKLSFRADPTFHLEQFKIVNLKTNEELK
ncbi:MAG: Rne/Rng family ribonuclease [Verrucomicrobia bacterium]|nr:Rne/Rng family ribonuclease [Verrucomicrobiota bacterium]